MRLVITTMTMVLMMTIMTGEGDEQNSSHDADVCRLRARRPRGGSDMK